MEPPNEQVQAIIANNQHIHLSAGFIVPFELLSGIPKSDDRSASVEFQRRKAALIKYERLVGATGTYWDTPSEVRARAFGVRSCFKNAHASRFSHR